MSTRKQRMAANPGEKRSELPTPNKENREGINAETYDRVRTKAKSTLDQLTGIVVPGNSVSSLETQDQLWFLLTDHRVRTAEHLER